MSMNGRGLLSVALVALALTSFLVSFVYQTPAVRAAALYDSGNPTPDEQLVLEYINRARANPTAEGQRLGIDIHEGLEEPNLVGPRPPLAMNRLLLSIAEAHSRDMYNQNYFSHNDPNGTTPFGRMMNAGYDYQTAGENMAAGWGLAATRLEDLMMIDAGTEGRLHRVNLLDIFPYPCSYPPCIYYEIGIGYYAGGSGNSYASDFITEDFGATGTGPFLLGVVYNDRNSNNFYDIGEGIGGVTITASGASYYAVSSSSGGYAIPIGSSGTITVTASGSGFGPFTKTVTVNGANVKVDFTSSGQTSGSTTTLVQTSTTSTSTLSTSSTAQTTSTFTINGPSVSLNPISASAGAIVSVSGSSFSPSDTECLVLSVAVESPTCSVLGGTLTGSFVVANVSAGIYTVAAAGSPAGDYASATFTVNALGQLTTTSTQTSTVSSTNSTLTTVSSSTTTQIQQTTTSAVTNSSAVTSSTSLVGQTIVSQPTGSDMSIAISPEQIVMPQASSATFTVTVNSVGVFTEPVDLQAVGLPAGVEVTFSPDPVTPSPNGIVTSTATIVVQRSVPMGPYTFQIIAQGGPVEKESTIHLQVSGCLIATATFGSELAAEVQFLRNFRDYKILRTFAGSNFMIVFNAWYYSFSPSVAQAEYSHSALRGVMRFLLYPLLGILRIGAQVFDGIPSKEAAAIVSGVTVSSLLGAFYLSPVFMAVAATSRKSRRRLRELEAQSCIGFLLALVFVLGADVFRIAPLIMVAGPALLLATLTLAGLATSRLALRLWSAVRT